MTYSLPFGLKQKPLNKYFEYGRFFEKHPLEEVK